MEKSILIRWDLYEIHTETTPIHGVKMRGRIRLFGNTNNINILCDNATDAENCVRVALLAGENHKQLSEFLTTIVPDIKIQLVMSGVSNPVLSKLLVNQEDWYTI